MPAKSPIVTPIKSHVITFEPPNLVYISLVGPLMAVDAQALIARIHELGREFGPMFWLIDVSQFKLSGERVRDLFIHGGRERYPIIAGVMCGAPFPVRVAMTMALTAGSRIAPTSFAFPFEFTATQEQARAWISSMQAALTASPTSITSVAAE